MVCPFRRGHRPGGDELRGYRHDRSRGDREPPDPQHPGPGHQGRPHPVTAAIAASIVFAVVRLWPDVRSTLLALDPWTVAAAFVAALAAIAANVKAWQAVLHELDHDVPTVSAGQIYLVGRARQVPAGQRLGLRAADGAVAARRYPAGPVLRRLAHPRRALDDRRPPARPVRHPHPRRRRRRRGLGAAALAPVALICAIPPVLSRLVDLFLRILGRAGLNHRLRADRPAAGHGLVGRWPGRCSASTSGCSARASTGPPPRR